MFPIVGIGASAGGLRAISHFLDAMPGDSGCAFVVVVHLDPTHESAFASLLANHTTMPVADIRDQMAAEPNRVHVIVPDRTLTILDGALRLSDPAVPRGQRHPIDAFFESLAEDCQERAIGIVLSGTGSNGSHGLREIRARGGMTLVQDPESAQFDGMPRSAISAGVADQVLAPEKMPEVLLHYVRHSYVSTRDGIQTTMADESSVLDTILTIVRDWSGHAFGGYKENTLLRRIHRRMGLNDVQTLADYADVLSANPGEIKALSTDLMISVTGYFRDPEAWQALDTAVLAPLVTERQTGAPVRLWVPACASGEEAYSLAMLAFERAEATGKQFDVKIFASDPQKGNLAAAREGIYHAAAVEAISPERLNRFFDPIGDAYQVKKDLRERIVFAPHDLLRDPPFSHLDLISCRNILIYLDKQAQRKIIARFHFALREGGALFLGNAETIDNGDGLFEQVSKKWRIYRRLGPTRYDILNFPGLDPEARQGGNVLARLNRALFTRPADLAQRALLERFAPAAVLIDRKGHILYFHGATGGYLQQPTGEPSTDLVGMARKGLQAR
ncbi:MAG: chemotaxis protein CheB, partial [Gammaproteobacteria bacterium]